MKKILLFTLAFCLLRPIAVQAQEKYEINVGVSTQGLAQVANNWNFFNHPDHSTSLTELEDHTYRSFFFPGFSVGFAYKLADSGFFKKLDLVGYSGLQPVGYQEVDITSGNGGEIQLAIRASFLVGLRLKYCQKPRFKLYSQFMFGTDIINKCRYWDIVFDNLSDGKRTTMQLTYIGCNIKLGSRDSKLYAMAELGYGSEYAEHIIPLVPGFRTGLSYRF